MLTLWRHVLHVDVSSVLDEELAQLVVAFATSDVQHRVSGHLEIENQRKINFDMYVCMKCDEPFSGP